MSFVVTGIATGALHAVSGPDHVLGLAPLALARRRGAWRLGLVWGAGHALGTAVSAAALAALLAAVDLEVAGAWGERIAGGALVALGIAGLARRAAAHGAAPGVVRPGAVLLVGLVHGATGAAGLLLLAPAALAGSPADAIAYLAAFGAGSTVAMAAVTAGLAAAARRVVRLAAAASALSRAASALSVLVGAWWAVA